MLTVDISSWHYRVYAHWRANIARKPPMQIDLCHYMRAILLFTPGYYVGIGLFYAAIGVAFALAAAFLLVTLPLWGPVWLITHNRTWHKGLAARIKYRMKRGAHRTGGWMADKGHYVLIGLGVVTIAVYFVLLTLDTWWYGIAIYGGILAGLALAVALGVGIYHLVNGWFLPRRREKLAARPPKEPKEAKPRKVKQAKGPGVFSLMWSWIKAKKKRICPLIQTNDTVQP